MCLWCMVCNAYLWGRPVRKNKKIKNEAAENTTAGVPSSFGREKWNASRSWTRYFLLIVAAIASSGGGACHQPMNWKDESQKGLPKALASLKSNRLCMILPRASLGVTLHMCTELDIHNSTILIPRLHLSTLGGGRVGGKCQKKVTRAVCNPPTVMKMASAPNG